MGYLYMLKLPDMLISILQDNKERLKHGELIRRLYVQTDQTAVRLHSQPRSSSLFFFFLRN